MEDLSQVSTVIDGIVVVGVVGIARIQYDLYILDDCPLFFYGDCEEDVMTNELYVERRAA